MKPKQTFKGILLISMIILSVFSLFIISHEAVHYFAMEEPIGMCFGDCNGYIATTYGKGTEPTEYQRNIEEVIAWNTSSLIVLLYLISLVYVFNDNVKLYKEKLKLLYKDMERFIKGK